MSIATDEAENKYPAPTDADDSMYKYVEATAGYPSVKRQGYVAGRTAEPTEAEIAAARNSVCAALLEAYQPTRMIVNGLTVKSIDPDPCIVTLSDGTRLHVDRLVRLVLDAAHRAVA